MGGKQKSGVTGRFAAGKKTSIFTRRNITKGGAGDRRRGIVATAEDLKETIKQNELVKKIKRLTMLLGRLSSADAAEATATATVQTDAADRARLGDLEIAADLLQQELTRRNL